MPAKKQSGLDMYLQKHPIRRPERAGGKTTRAKRKPKSKRVRQDVNVKLGPRAPVIKAGVATGFQLHNSPTMAADLETFKIALRDPFDVRAIGARVCDSYTLPTATYHVRTAVKITTNSTGDATGAFLPSPCFSWVSAATSAGGVDPTSGLSKFTQNPVTSWTTAGGAYLVSPLNLSGVLSEYRTVSWGVRFIAKDTALASKGKLYVAVVPTTENAPSWNTMDTVTGTQSAIGEYTVGMDCNNFASIINLPGVRTFSMQDLLRGEVMVCGTPTNAAFYQFKGTMDRQVVSWNTGQVLADEGVFNNATGLVNATAGGRKDVASLRGGRAIIFALSGAPASTNELDVEVIYHLEGSPNIAGSLNGGALVPSSMRPAAGSTALVEKAISMASAARVVFQYITDPANVAAATRAMAWLGL